MGVMILLLFLQVFSRYVLRHAFSWTEELALIFFILSIYFGATAAIRRDKHLRLAILLDKMKPKGKLVLQIIDDIFFIIFNCIILTGLYSLVERLYRNQARAAVTGIPKWCVYIFLPLLFALMIIRLIQDIVSKAALLKNSSHGENGAVTEKQTTEKGTER
jgi:TRAP-type C4-dicarboxylate transport system permease small subunit